MPKSQIITASIANAAVDTDQIAASAVTSEKASGVNQARNLIINGAMNLAQRGTSVASITSTGYQTLDRFNLLVENLGTWTMSQDTDVPAGQGFAKSLKIDCTTADASPAVSDRMFLRQTLEGQDLQHMKKGTVNAESVTLSFWVKATKTGTHIVNLYDNDNARVIAQAYTVSSSNTWEHKSLTFAGDTTGAFDNDNAGSMQIVWGLGCGTNYSSGTLQTTWASSSNANRFVGQVNTADSTSNNWAITGVQMEVGSTATPFEHKTYAEELSLCQRYYEVIIQGSTAGADFSSYFPWIGLCQGSKSDQINFLYDFKVQKRATGGTSVNETVSNGYEMYNHSTQKLGNTMGTNSNNMELRRGLWWLGGSQSGIGEQSSWAFRIKNTSCFLAYDCEL